MDHLPEHIEEAGRDGKNREHDEQVGQGIGILKGMSRVGIEEAATICAQILDNLLRGHRPLSNHLRGALQSMHHRIWIEVLHHALRDIDQRAHHRKWQQHIEHTAREINPEIPQRLRAAPGQAANKCDRQHDAGGGRDEVVEGQAGHLRQIAHRLLASVVLPVGIRREAGGGIKCELRLDIRQMLGIERQPLLGALDNVQKQHARKAEEQHGDHIPGPPLLLGGIDAT